MGNESVHTLKATDDHNWYVLNMNIPSHSKEESAYPYIGLTAKIEAVDGFYLASVLTRDEFVLRHLFGERYDVVRHRVTNAGEDLEEVRRKTHDTLTSLFDHMKSQGRIIPNSELEDLTRYAATPTSRR